MTLRVSTSGLHLGALDALRRHQEGIARLQQQIGTGVKLTRAADDPSGAATAQGLDHALAMLARFDRNGALLGDRLRQQEAAFDDIGDALTRARELVIQADNAALSAGDRHAIALELRSLRSSLLQVANREDERGRRLFAGTRDGVVPFVDNAGNVAYAGDDGQNLVEVAPDVSLADTEAGSRVFLRVPTGDGVSRGLAGGGNTGSGVLEAAQVTDPAAWNGATLTLRFTSASSYEVVDGAGNPLAPPVAGSWTPGQTITAQGVQFKVSGAPAAGDSFTVERAPNQDIFATLQALADALDSPGASPADTARRSNALRAGLADLATAHQHVLDLQAETGVRRAALDQNADRREADSVAMQEMLSDLRDTDLAEAISRLQLKLTALEAAQRMMARLQGSSLFDRL